jgi:hypothetical protein
MGKDSRRRVEDAGRAFSGVEHNVDCVLSVEALREKFFRDTMGFPTPD